MRCNGDEDSLVDCPDVEIGINGGINAPTCRNNADDLDVGIICSMTCNELFWNYYFILNDNRYCNS